MEKLQEALTFSDVLIVPAYTEALPSEVDLRTHFTRGITLNVPLASAAMDTVTESALAIALAQEGGIGVIHKNMSVQEQSYQVRQVKKYESGVIKDPITVSPDATIHEVIELTKKNEISGVPVVTERELVGIVTHRDLRFETRLDEPVTAVMTPKDRLVTVKEGADKSEVQRLLHKHRIEKVLVVNDDFELCGMITVKDFQKSSDFPNACKDSQGRLRVAAAIGVGKDAYERSEALCEAEADAVVIDTAHAHSKVVLDMIKDLRKRYPEVQLVAGNVVTAAAAKSVAEAGVDAIKVGIGPGSICTTRIVTGVGVPQITAINHVSQAVKNKGIPVIADGGIHFSGDAAKAIVAGASVIMLGNLFAGTAEAPGEVELYQGRAYKGYRGMGSLAGMQKGSSSRYFQEAAESTGKFVPEGIEGRVPYRGSIVDIIFQLLGGIRSSMGYAGCSTIEEMRTRPRFIRTTQAGVKESHVHSVLITKEAPNYQIDD